MAGLNELISSKDVATTAMPGWYSTATQNVGTGAAGVTPTAPGSTALPSAAGAFGPTGQFQAGSNVLQSIGQGAANPWLTSTSPTGQTTVTPDTSTAMGGLFQAQKDYLNEILPDINATATAPSIGAGGFGSKMNLSAIGKARSQAASDLFQKQMQSALQNQQTGVSAGAGLGNIGNQLVQSGLNTATYQQNLPYADYINQAKILQALSPDKTTTEQKQLSPLGQIAGLGSMVSGGLNSLLGGTSIDPKTGKPVVTPSMLDQINNLYKRLSGGSSGDGGTTGGEGTYGGDAENQEGGFYGDSSSPSYDYDVENQQGGFYGGAAGENPFQIRYTDGNVGGDAENQIGGFYGNTPPGGLVSYLGDAENQPGGFYGE